MAGAFGTFTVLDGTGATQSMRVWDESGAGTGPFTFTCDYPGSDGSGTITAGGTAQNLFAGATPPHGFILCNPDPSEALWFPLSTTAVANGQGSMALAPSGGVFITPPGMVPFHAISVVAATTGHKFTAPTAASTSLQFTPTAAVSGSYNCNAQGYYAG